MRRRQVLSATAGAAAVVAAPRIGRAQGARALRFIPQADLSTLDPHWNTAYVTRNHGFMVFDTLYGMDSQYRATPQMVDGHAVEDDGRLWTLTLLDVAVGAPAPTSPSTSTASISQSPPSTALPGCPARAAAHPGAAAGQVSTVLPVEVTSPGATVANRPVTPPGPDGPTGSWTSTGPVAVPVEDGSNVVAVDFKRKK